MTARPIDIKEIVARLNREIARLAAEVLPGGWRQQQEWHVPAKNSPLGGSIDVHIGPGRTGIWKCWASDEGGDALDLIALVECGGDKKRAIGWAKAWLGIDGSELDARDRETFQPKGALTVAPKRDPGKLAFRLFLEAKADIRGTPVEAYLEGRGISLRRLGAYPGALRYEPRCAAPGTNGGSPRDPDTRYWPAMIAGVQLASRIVAVHRTYLQVQADGRVSKAPVGDSGKAVLGPCGGGLIPLRRGASGKPLRQAPQGDSIVLAEGIENGLSAAMKYPGDRVAAALNIGNLSKIELPPAIAKVIIVADNDAWWQDAAGADHAGRPHAAGRGLDKAIRHFQAQGRQVFLRRARTGKDLNDELRAEA